MRVALLTPEISPGYGWARYALELSEGLEALGVDVVVLTQHDVLPRLVPPLRGFLLRSLLALPRVRRAAAGCDLLHVVAEPYTLLAAAIAGTRPLIVTAHGTYVPQTSRRRGIGAFYRRAYQRAHLIAVSDYTAGRVRDVLPNAHLTTIRNGVRVARFAEAVPAPQKRGPTVLATGGVKSRKGTHLLVAALAEVRQSVPDAQLVVTGRQDDAPYLAQVQAQIAALGLDDAVHLVGSISESDLIGWYQHADVFALPALSVGDRFEGFGLVLLEASASGLPVISTSGSGVEEAMIDGETGLLVPQNDVPALAAALLRLLNDAALRERMGSAGRAYAQTQDWSVVAERVAALYQAVS